jgi:hypothetical protein
MPDLEDAEDVANWLRTEPPAHEQAQAVDDLIGLHGNSRGLSIFAQGIAIVAGTEDER